MEWSMLLTIFSYPPLSTLLYLDSLGDTLQCCNLTKFGLFSGSTLTILTTLSGHGVTLDSHLHNFTPTTYHPTTHHHPPPTSNINILSLQFDNWLSFQMVKMKNMSLLITSKSCLWNRKEKIVACCYNFLSRKSFHSPSHSEFVSNQFSSVSP